MKLARERLIKILKENKKHCSKFLKQTILKANTFLFITKSSIGNKTARFEQMKLKTAFLHQPNVCKPFICESGEGILVSLRFLGEDERPNRLSVLDPVESSGDIDFFTAKSLSISCASFLKTEFILCYHTRLRYLCTVAKVLYHKFLYHIQNIRHSTGCSTEFAAYVLWIQLILYKL